MRNMFVASISIRNGALPHLICQKPSNFSVQMKENIDINVFSIWMKYSCLRIGENKCPQTDVKRLHICFKGQF